MNAIQEQKENVTQSPLLSLSNQPCTLTTLTPLVDRCYIYIYLLYTNVYALLDKDTRGLYAPFSFYFYITFLRYTYIYLTRSLFLFLTDIRSQWIGKKTEASFIYLYLSFKEVHFLNTSFAIYTSYTHDIISKMISK